MSLVLSFESRNLLQNYLEIHFKTISGTCLFMFFVSSTTRFCLFCIYSCLGTITKHNLSYSFVFLQNEEFLFIVLEIDSWFLISVFNRAVHLIEFNHSLPSQFLTFWRRFVNNFATDAASQMSIFIASFFFFFYCSDDDICCTEVMWNGPIIPW